MATRKPPGRGTFHAWNALHPPGFSKRSVRVYEPAAGLPGRPRPVLVLFDGQNVFGDEGSFVGGWHVHEAVEKLTPRSFDAPLVVGIDHGHAARLGELSPFDFEHAEGRADAFLDWVAGSVVPRVRREFSVLPGPGAVTIGGSSMGGLAALYAHFRHPGTFGGAMVLSPSFQVARGGIFHAIATRPVPTVSRLYLDAGAKEGRGSVLALAERMARDLRRRGYDETRLLWRPDARGQHNERHWRRRLPKALRFLFRRGPSGT